MIEEIKSNKVRLHGAINSMQGGRPENQDDVGFTDTPLGFLLIVCDGMGGGPGGRTASGIVKRTFIDTICCCAMHTSREEAMKKATARAQEGLVNAMRMQPELTGMGSTFVAILINEQSALITHAGDSRAYRLHGNHMLFRSEDHSLVEELVKRKALTREEARMSPQSNIITRGLGSMSNNIPQIDEVAYRMGDRFVLCTDGVWGILPHQELIKRLTQPMNETALVNTLSAEIDNIGKANGGGHDNHTLAMISMDCSSKKNDLSSWLQPKYMLIAASVLVTIVVVSVIVILLLSNRKDYTPYNAGGGFPTMANEPQSNKSKSESQDNMKQDSGYSSELLDSLKSDSIKNEFCKNNPTNVVDSDIAKDDTNTQNKDAVDDSIKAFSLGNANVNLEIQSPEIIIKDIESCLDSMLRMKNEDANISIKNQEELYDKVLGSIDPLDTLSSRKAHSEIRTFKKLLTMKANPANRKSTPRVTEIDMNGAPTWRARDQLNKTKKALDGVKSKLFK